MNEELHGRLEVLYDRLNRPEFVSPDPLQFVLACEGAQNQEVVGLIAAALAFGNVQQILGSVNTVLERMPEPAMFLRRGTAESFARTFAGFRHRYAGEDDLVRLLVGMKAVIAEHGSLGAGFLAGHEADEETVVPALQRFVDALRAPGGEARNCLLPDPRLGSACKRLHLYLRWMIRDDAVDTGIWRGIRPSKLIMPVDTHIHRMGLRLGMTQRKQGNLATALEITEGFRAMEPEDPVKYDFALSRLGIRGELSPDMLFG